MKKKFIIGIKVDEHTIRNYGKGQPFKFGRSFDEIGEVKTVKIKFEVEVVEVLKETKRTFYLKGFTGMVMDCRTTVLKEELNVVRKGKLVWCLLEDVDVMFEELKDQYLKKVENEKKEAEMRSVEAKKCFVDVENGLRKIDELVKEEGEGVDLEMMKRVVLDESVVGWSWGD